MQQLVYNIRDQLEPGLELDKLSYGVHRYAVSMFMEYIERKGLNLWDDASRIGKVTEEDLLNNAQDWRQYSRDGNSLIYNRDICLRLCNQRDQKRTKDGKFPPNDHETWLDLQANALQQAAQLIINIVNNIG